MEKIKQLELRTEELLNILDSIKWELGYRFYFNGTNFHIITTPADEINESVIKGERDQYGEPAEYHQSTETDGYDIYLHDTIPESERKRVLFHEILEANLQNQGFSEKDAHSMTLQAEEKIFGQR